MLLTEKLINKKIRLASMSVAMSLESILDNDYPVELNSLVKNYSDKLLEYGPIGKKILKEGIEIYKVFKEQIENIKSYWKWILKTKKNLIEI